MGWKQVPIRRIFRVVNGGTPTAETENWDGGIPWATPIDIGSCNGGLMVSTIRTLTAKGLRNGSTQVPSDSLVVSTRAPIGYVAQTVSPLAFNQGCRGLAPKRRLDIRYFRYVLTSLASELQSRGQGSTFVELSTDALASTLVPLPPETIQASTADFLDVETVHINSLITKKRALSGVLDERASRDLNNLFGSEHLLSWDGVPVGLPGLECVRLGYLARVQSGLTVDVLRESDVGTTALPYLRVANVQDGYLNLDEVKTITVPRELASRCSLQPGDVLMTEGGDPDKLGRGAVWPGEIRPCLHQNHVFAVRPDRRRLLPEYLALVTRSAYGRRYFEVTSSKTTGIASTSTAKIAAFKVPLPSVETQKEMVDEYLVGQAIEEAIQRSLTQQISLLQERRQALITAAVTGELEILGAD